MLASAGRSWPKEYTKGMTRRPVSQVTYFNFGASSWLLLDYKRDPEIDFITPGVGCAFERERLPYLLSRIELTGKYFLPR